MPAAPSAAAAGELGTLSARRWGSDPGVLTQLTPLGSLVVPADAKVAPYEMKIDLSRTGAGVASLALSQHFDKLGKDRQNEQLQIATEKNGQLIVPLSLLAVKIENQVIGLADPAATDLWREVSPGVLQAEIVRADGSTAARITRTFSLQPGRFDFTVKQTLENLSGRALNVQFFQMGPEDLPLGVVRYGGDIRRARMGYLPLPSSNPDGQTVLAKRYMKVHPDVMGTAPNPPTGAWPELKLWPTADSIADNDTLAWTGLTNRYFAVVVHALPDSNPKRPDGLPNKQLLSVSDVDRVVLGVADASGDVDAKASVVALRLTGPVISVAAGATTDASFGVYAGPITRETLAADPVLESMGLPGLRVFTFGGPCGFCTFQPIAYFLRGFLGVLHDYVVFDWALAIIVLVLCVKTLLHPITFWSQAKISRFGKQMAALAPKQAKLKEKYGNDPKKMREEVAKLMREEQVDYGGMLGCFPMLLQTPIWIAVYATIFFTFELRHEGAFFGVFQAISGGSWHFLADLAEPDGFIPLGTSIHVPLISSIMGPIESINLLPLLLGAVFFVQQKYMTPPSTTPLTPEQETTQKIMKVMIVVMFPLMMYNAPSALSIYFITNSAIGIIESRRIRKQVEAEDKVREEAKKSGVVTGRKVAEPAKKGFFARLQDEVEKKQKALEAQRAEKEREERRKNNRKK